LLLLLLHLVAILANFQDQVFDSTTQTQAIATHFPETAIGDEKSLAIVKDFRAGCTLGLMFTIMQLIVLYVGTNRFRLKPTAFGTAFYMKHSLCTLLDFGSTWDMEDGFSKIFGL
jgi:hypothetical protein